MSEELSHTEDMTIEDFLSGATAYEIADNALKRVLVKRKIAFGTMVSELTERQLDQLIIMDVPQKLRQNIFVPLFI